MAVHDAQALYSLDGDGSFNLTLVGEILASEDKAFRIGLPVHAAFGEFWPEHLGAVLFPGLLTINTENEPQQIDTLLALLIEDQAEPRHLRVDIQHFDDGRKSRDTTIWSSAIAQPRRAEPPLAEPRLRAGREDADFMGTVRVSVSACEGDCDRALEISGSVVLSKQDELPEGRLVKARFEVGDGQPGFDPIAGSFTFPIAAEDLKRLVLLAQHASFQPDRVLLDIDLHKRAVDAETASWFVGETELWFHQLLSTPAGD